MQKKNGLTLTNTELDGVVVVRLNGYLDGHTFIHLEKHLDELIRGGKRRLVLDLAELGYIASAGVGLFINTNHRLKADGGGIQLANPSPSVKEIFAILGLDSLFTIHPTVSAGILAAKALG